MKAPALLLLLAAAAPTILLGAPVHSRSLSRHAGEEGGEEEGMQCNNASGVVVGFYYGSQGYKIVPAPTAAACCGMCASEVGKCLAWTWGNGDSKCHMKADEPDKENMHACEPPCSCGPPAPPSGPPAPPAPPAPPPAPAPVPPQPAGKPKGPNILLLFPDQWRYDWDGFTRENQPDIPGPMLHVPTTRGVAAAGTRFTTAYVPAPVCAPSRSCLASGREYGSTAVNGQPGNWSNVLSNGYDYPTNQVGHHGCPSWIPRLPAPMPPSHRPSPPTLSMSMPAERRTCGTQIRGGRPNVPRPPSTMCSAPAGITVRRTLAP